MKTPETGEASNLTVADQIEYERLSDYEKTVQLMVAEAHVLSERRFASETEASEAADEFIEEWWEELITAKGEYQAPEVTVSGEGIIVPDVEIVKNGADTLITFNEEDMIRVVEYPSSETGRLDSIYKSSMPIGNGHYGSMIHMSMVLSSSPEIEEKIDGLPLSLLNGRLALRAFIGLSDSIHFEVPERIRMDKEAETIDKIAKSGLVQTQLMRVVEALSNEMSIIDTTAVYTELEDPRRLQLITRQYVDMVNQGKYPQDVLLGSLMLVFRKGRVLKLVSDSLEVAEVQEKFHTPEEHLGVAEGRIQDVCFIYDENGTAINLSITIESEDDDGVKYGTRALLDQLDAVHF